jgi:hypothetical protein
VAASALLPVVPLLISGLAGGQVRQLAATLWAALLHLDDLTCSTHAILLLLSELLAAPGGLEAIAACSAAENSSEKPLAELVPRLFPFLAHASSVVRRASLQASGLWIRGSDQIWIPVFQVWWILLTWDTWGGVSRSPRRRVVDTYGLLCGPPLRNCPISGSSFGFPLSFCRMFLVDDKIISQK